MEPFALVAILGLFGGLVIALVSVHFHGRSRSARDPFQNDAPTDVINMSRIRVAGIGGLGLVAMALVVSIAVPGIGVPFAAGAALGVVAAVLLIGLRHRDGGMRSSAARPGANTTLSIDAPDTPRR
ncbi:MAG TPA: hypothetical protein VF147_14775 [Vicinamibacterales bacterium]